MGFYYRISQLNNLDFVNLKKSNSISDNMIDILYANMIFEFGKGDMLDDMVCDFQLLEKNKLTCSNEDNDYYILTKDMMLNIMEYYRKTIYDHFLGLLKDPKSREYCLENKEVYWKCLKNIASLNSKNKFEVSNAWLYEYEFFTLVNIYNLAFDNSHSLVIWGA